MLQDDLTWARCMDAHANGSAVHSDRCAAYHSTAAAVGQQQDQSNAGPYAVKGSMQAIIQQSNLLRMLAEVNAAACVLTSA